MTSHEPEHGFYVVCSVKVEAKRFQYGNACDILCLCVCVSFTHVPSHLYSSFVAVAIVCVLGGYFSGLTTVFYYFLLFSQAICFNLPSKYCHIGY